MKKSTLLELENDIHKNLASKGFWSKPLIFIDYKSEEDLHKFLYKFIDNIFFISNFVSDVSACEIPNIINKYNFDISNFKYYNGILYICTLKNSLSIDGIVLKKYCGKFDVFLGSHLVLNISKKYNESEFLFHIDIYPDQKNIEFFH